MNVQLIFKYDYYSRYLPLHGNRAAITEKMVEASNFFFLVKSFIVLRICMIAYVIFNVSFDGFVFYIRNLSIMSYLASAFVCHL